MKKIICCYTLFLLVVCTACISSSSQENYISLKNETWDRDSNYKFEINIPHPGTYTMSTCIRHTTDYRNKNISCYLTISHPGITNMTEITDISVSDGKGAWLGQGLGGLKTVVQPLNHVFHFDSTGMYTIEIRHLMKERQLENIKNVGIKLTKYANH